MNDFVRRICAGALALASLSPVCAAPGAADDGPRFRFTEPMGSSPVGFRVVEQFDYSRSYRPTSDELGRPFAGERARPIQLSIWYPGKERGRKPMTVGDYADLSATELSFGAPRRTTEILERAIGMKAARHEQMSATRDLPAAAGRYPVIFYAPSFSSTSWENADLCEYLASHGYLVVASASVGAATRGMTGDLGGIDAQARDISFAIGYAQALPNADISQVAVIGFSWGGMANLFAAARDNRIGALVALDGSLRYWPARIKEAGDVHPERMSIPLLYFSSQERTLEEWAHDGAGPDFKEDRSALNEWTHGDLVMVHMLGMTHGEYSSMFQRDDDFWDDYPNWQKADYGREDGMAGYAWMARYTLAFLDGRLKGDSAAKAFLTATPAQNGAPKHFMSVSYRAAGGVPPSFDGYRREIGRLGFAKAAEIYAALRKESADFHLDEVALLDWASDLVADDHASEALQLLQLAAALYPASSAVHTGLADMYAHDGKLADAMVAYKKALENDPTNARARIRLKRLQAAPIHAAPLPRPN